MSGHKPSVESRLKTSVALSGVPKSAEHRAKLSEANTGKKTGPMSQCHKDKISASHVGKKLSEPHKEKLSAAKIGKNVGAKRSDIHKANISFGLKGNTNWLGKKHSTETKEKMSLSMKECRFNYLIFGR